MAFRRIVFHPFSLCVFFSFFIFSCTKIDSTKIGQGLIPPIDGVNTRDTFFDVTSSMFKNLNDTFTVYRSDIHALGVINNDPLFGSTDAQLNIQIKPPAFPYYFQKSKDSLVLDSVVLVLAWYSNWGDTLTPIQLQVHEIDHNAPFRHDSTYTNYQQFATTGPSLVHGGSKTIYPTSIKYVDTLKTYHEAISNQIRIRLDDNFGKRFLNIYDSVAGNTVSGAYASDSAFNTYFRGLNIKAISGNALMEVSLSDTNTKMAFYYKVKQPDNSLKDSAVRYFRFNFISSASSNYIKRNIGSGSYNQALNNPAADSLIYMQASPGHKAFLQIPGVSGMRNIIVHRAELLLSQVQPFNAYQPFDKFFSPPNLFLAAYSTDSSRAFAIPYDVELSSYGITNLSLFGGFPLKVYENGNFSHYEYNFNITRYIQSIVTQHATNHKLMLYAPYFETINIAENSTSRVPILTSALNYPGVGRVLVGGGAYKSDASKRARVRIIFSEL